MFGWLKENRRIGTRYDKLARSFEAMFTLACSLRCMQQYFSYKPNSVHAKQPGWGIWYPEHYGQ